MTHLQHEDYNYYIQVNNLTKVPKDVVFRIFIAPIKDEAGRTFSLREQRLLMIELDKFVLSSTFQFFFSRVYVTIFYFSSTWKEFGKEVIQGFFGDHSV